MRLVMKTIAGKPILLLESFVEISDILSNDNFCGLSESRH